MWYHDITIYRIPCKISLRMATYWDPLHFLRKEEKHGTGTTNRDSAVITTNRRVSSIRMWLRTGGGGVDGGRIPRRGPAGTGGERREREREREIERERNGPARFARSFPNSFLQTGSRRRICAFHWISECRLGPMAQRNADCRCRCVVFQGGRLRPAQRVRIYASGRVVVRTKRDKEEREREREREREKDG